ncbi:hypothetical protein KY290_028670 [Solanum tuberosum]|uniref:Oxidative stress 3 n=3 Tax=Solanum tuberosum TaxID=4113 RepID=A0ABQ7UKG0_SOLTU|nr:PREDICTED: uncharacterized protein LOC102599951 [Solanum tuberosum]KAH0749438.1 hypothetical protein KY290_028670 [Solanum tuberosum]
MGDGNIEMFKDKWFQCGNNLENKNCSSWMINEGDNNSPSSSSIGESSSTISILNCNSSLETMDDASSDGALSDLSTLMAQLPIKKGLSEYYDGKSESFTCLGRVTSLEDLPKKENRCNRKMKKSLYKSYTLPKPIMFKKASRSSFLSSCYTSKRPSSSISRSSRPPLIPVQRT